MPDALYINLYFIQRREDGMKVYPNVALKITER